MESNMNSKKHSNLVSICYLAIVFLFKACAKHCHKVLTLNGNGKKNIWRNWV